MIWTLLSASIFLLWLGLILAPWQPWRVREYLEATDADEVLFEDLTVLIPARNEASVIGRTLNNLRQQGNGFRIIVMDDDSSDDTAEIAQQNGAETWPAGPLPAGWAGKLWALEQGRKRTLTPLILLLDADIALQPGILAAMVRKLRAEKLQLVSLMAWLRMVSPWERLLMPAFIYFFKLLYPFRLANSPRTQLAAAAGGCVLVDAAALEEIGGFASLRDALIDDCTLASRIKRAGGRTWIGLTHAAKSLRAYDSLDEIWNMIARSAFTQLRYSTGLLLLCSVLMCCTFGLPIACLAGPPLARLFAFLALVTMMGSYVPTLRYYHRSSWWSLTLPIIAGLYLAMTWASALRYWRGEKSHWKNRIYQRQ